MLHNLQNFLSIQFLNRSSDNCCLLVNRTKKLHGFHCFFLIYNISTAHNDRTCILNLIIEKFAKVSHIHFTFLCIHNCGIAVQFNINFLFYALYSLNNIRKFTNTRWLNQDTIRMIFLHNLFKRSTKISNQRTADATGIHLTDLDSGILKETTINPDFAKLILNQDYLLTFEGFLQKLLNKSCLSGSKEPGNNVNLYHFIFPFLI